MFSHLRQHLLALTFAFAGIAAATGTTSAGTAGIELMAALPQRANLGPVAASGAVIWSHGRSIYEEDSLSPSPLYLEALRNRNWDVFRLNRLRDMDTLQDSSLALVAYVHQLREQGYQRVVLAGQSFGGFLSLIAAGMSDEVHAVVATAPAAYGNFSDYYESWQNNATYLYPLLQSVRSARVMLFYFHGDDFDPGGRGERSREILSARGLDYLVVDRPAALTGHWAASSGLFVRRFASCIGDFIGAVGFDGEPACDDSWGRRPSAQITLPIDFRAASGSSMPGGFTGKWYGFYPNGRELMLGVEAVRGNTVTAVYALGPGVSDNQPAEWARRTGHVVGNQLVFDEKDRNPLRYTLRPDGKLAAQWTALDGKGSLEAVLRRVE